MRQSAQVVEACGLEAIRRQAQAVQIGDDQRDGFETKGGDIVPKQMVSGIGRAVILIQHMCRVVDTNQPIARRNSDVMARLDLQPRTYALVTAHRAGNTDNPVRLQQIVTALNSVPETVVFPAHPRTSKMLTQLDAHFASHVKLIEPVSYFDMMVLEENARLIATDSGGVQREAYFLGIPCLTLRDETEWVETLEVGWNKLVGVDPERVVDAWFNFAPPAERPPIFGDGTAAQHIAQILKDDSVALGLRYAGKRAYGESVETLVPSRMEVSL